MNKKMALFIATLVAVFALVVIKKRNTPTKDQITIGILQYASFPPLDEARKGFVEQIKKDFGEKVLLIHQNAQGSLTQAQAIASSYRANPNIQAFYAIATPAVQALKSEIKKRPIAFAAVTDPIGIHLREPLSNITGATDMVDIPKQIKVLRKLMPAVKKVAILYNPGETNSVILVKKMKEELTKYGIQFQINGTNSQADVAAATHNALQNSDAILIPTDNTVTAAFPIVKQLADKAKKPIIASWNGEKYAPLMQFGVDYHQSGVQAAGLVKEILAHGKKASELEILSPNSTVFISKEELEKFGLTIPQSLEHEVTLL